MTPRGKRMLRTRSRQRCSYDDFVLQMFYLFLRFADKGASIYKPPRDGMGVGCGGGSASAQRDESGSLHYRSGVGEGCRASAWSSTFVAFVCAKVLLYFVDLFCVRWKRGLWLFLSSAQVIVRFILRTTGYHVRQLLPWVDLLRTLFVYVYHAQSLQPDYHRYKRNNISNVSALP